MGRTPKSIKQQAIDEAFRESLLSLSNTVDILSLEIKSSERLSAVLTDSVDLVKSILLETAEVKSYTTAIILDKEVTATETNGKPNGLRHQGLAEKPICTYDVNGDNKSHGTIYSKEIVRKSRLKCNLSKDYMLEFLEKHLRNGYERSSSFFYSESQNRFRGNSTNKSKQNQNNMSCTKHSFVNFLTTSKNSLTQEIEAYDLVTPKTNYLNQFLYDTASPNETKIVHDASHQIMCSLLNDKIFQLYTELTKPIMEHYENVKKFIAGKIKLYEDREVSMNDMMSTLGPFTEKVITFAKDIPGINELVQEDFTLIINRCLLDYFNITHSIFFIKGESYLIFPNKAQYKRSLMNVTLGSENADKMFAFAEHFNALDLTIKEKALFLTLLFTLPDERVSDTSSLNVLNKYYTKQLLYEFDLNKRDYEFLVKFRQILLHLKDKRAFND